METYQVTCRTLEDFYHIATNPLETVQGSHQRIPPMGAAGARTEWLLFPKNMGSRLAIDESSLSNGELYTFVTNRDVRTRERSR